MATLLPFINLVYFLFFLKQSLEEALKKALKGHLEDVVVALLKTPAQFDAEELRASMKVRQNFQRKTFLENIFVYQSL